ncbi:hypothetical protein Ciccas_010266 [Cichlidogyrus casuarinus]|uniref:ATPase AAA-type core domain-containing protein n=1 Tax=Cichlidogyrus casuarinus TaxID=1844966 RepID=A0ABD2PV67_9PLAT
MVLDLFLDREIITSNDIKVFSPLVLKNHGLCFSFSSEPPRSFITSRAKQRLAHQNIRDNSFFDFIEYSLKHRLRKSPYGPNYPVDNNFITIGSHDIIRVLGLNISIHFTSIKANDKCFVSAHECPLLALDEELVLDSEEQNELTGNVSFSEESSDLTLFKVMATTDLKIARMSPSHSNQTNPPLYGLDCSFQFLQSLIVQFNGSCEALHSFPEAFGALIYGLHGCGKRTLLEKLYSHFSLSDKNLNVGLITRNHDLEAVKSLLESSNGRGTVIFIPSFDQWLHHINIDKSNTVTEESSDDDPKINPNTVSQFLAVILASSSPVMLVVSCVDDHSVLQNPDLRKVIYKKHLVHLPIAETRLRILSDLMKQFNLPLFQALPHVAANMHGYTVG